MTEKGHVCWKLEIVIYTTLKTLCIKGKSNANIEKIYNIWKYQIYGI